MKSIPGAESRLDQLAREGLGEVAWPLVSDVFATGQRRALRNVEIFSPFGSQTTDIIADPMEDQTVLLIFNLTDRLRPIVDEFEVAPPSQEARFSALQDENRVLRRQVKEKVEEIETANEELKSSNEEMMSMNEGLQSSNEELTTANEELKNKIDELMFANADLDNLLQSPDLAMVVLDRHMRIRHLSEAARKLLPLMRKDEGRLISEFDLRLGDLPVERRVREVIDTGVASYETVDSTGWDASFLLRITPYVFASGKVDGVTMSFVDITNEVELRRTLANETKKLRLALRSSMVGSRDADLEEGALEIDEIAAELVGLAGAGTYDRDTVLRRFDPDDRAEHVRLRDTNIPKGLGYEHVVKIVRPDRSYCVLKITASPFTTHNGRKMVSCICAEVSDRGEASPADN